MRVMVVVDHPYGAGAWDNTPHHRSFTAALAHAACQGLEAAGHDVDLVDLHADGFNPVMSAGELAAWRQGVASPDPLAADYQRRLLDADHLVLAFPIWWESTPAATKGFIDKAVAKGIAYTEAGQAAGRPAGSAETTGLDDGKRAPGNGLRPMVNATKLTGVTLITVMSTPMWLYRAVFSTAITKILLRGTFRKIGVPNLTWLGHSGVDKKTPAERQRLLDSVQRRFASLR